jgi:predicted ATP-binding protein involved in virulence
MKLEHLKLENFRGFSSFEISFDPQFTVLLGENMAGKSAVLDGTAVALGAFLWTNQLGMGKTIADAEIRRVVHNIDGVPDLQLQFPVVAEIVAAIDDSNDRTTFRQRRDAHLIDTYSAAPMPQPLARSETLVAFPLAAHYGTQRLWRGQQIEQPIGVGSREDGYDRWFDSAATHGLFAGWMRKQTLVQLQRGGHYVQPQLAAVESAVKRCIADVRRFWFDVQYDELRLERISGDVQSFAMLSEGVRSMVAMVADIAWRAAVINPHLGPDAHLTTDGVVLIDELDLHLHPAWQRRIVGDLQRTFPRIQFIVTTHSPQIVASVHRSQIRLLDHNRLVEQALHVEGRATNEILEDVFGVAARPEQVQAELDKMYQLIEDDAFAAARAQLAKLRERLGPEDSDMVRAQWILDTEDPSAIEQPTAAP